MCFCCKSNTAKKLWSFGISIFLIVLAFIFGFLVPALIQNEIDKEFVLKEGTQLYETWMEAPVPIYLELYVWDCTNSAEFLADNKVKLNFVERGPYVFHERHDRVNITWNDNSTVTFNQKRIWEYVPNMSNGSLEDKITNLNVIYLTVASNVQNTPLMELMDAIIEGNDLVDSIFWDKITVEDLLFGGYEDTLLTALLELLAELPEEVLEGFDIPPFDKFGWFYERNNSADYDGVFNMGTGADRKENLGLVKLWNGVDQTKFYRGACGGVYGTTGEVFPSMKRSKNPAPITVFATDVCRAVTLKYSGKYSKFGVSGYKWAGDDSVFDNGEKYPQNECFCAAADPEECPLLKSGVMDVSKCKLGAPATVSYPHFYLADDSYRTQITGMMPNQEDHEFMVALEPITGIPLDVKAQLQVNIRLADYGLSRLKNMPDIMVPQIWFRQIAQLNEDLAKDTKLVLLLPNIGVYVAIALGALGAISLALSLWLSCTKWR